MRCMNNAQCAQVNLRNGKISWTQAYHFEVSHKTYFTSKLTLKPHNNPFAHSWHSSVHRSRSICVSKSKWEHSQCDSHLSSHNFANRANNIVLFMLTEHTIYASMVCSLWLYIYTLRTFNFQHLHVVNMYNREWSHPCVYTRRLSLYWERHCPVLILFISRQIAVC